MRNKLTDLNNHLFAEIERLGDEDLKGESLAAEIVRAHAVSEIASRIIANGDLLLKAKIAGTEKLGGDVEVPRLLG
ncbi:MAG: hypothetical protein LBG27_11650 [Spirochaetaceae bacterium]|jgi:hypothetical protein|nr:hypothetical protein [Spirochaetaceae bacterium]